MEGLKVKRGTIVVPLTHNELTNTLTYIIKLEITVLEQRFSRARNRMVKLGIRNQIQDLHTKLNNIHEY